MTTGDVLAVSTQWYLTYTLLAVAALPLVLIVCRSLPDRGITIVRPVGLALVPLPLWILGNLMTIPFNAGVLLGMVLLIGIPGWLLAIRHLQLGQILKERWRWLVVSEVVTLLLFASYIWFRGFYPDIAGTEKPMELAFLNASINSGELPVPDPWFANETINYYYFGYVALASLALISNAPGEISFNLGLAIIFASATVAAAGLAANLAELINGSRRIAIVGAGLLSGFMVALAGNLHAVRMFIQDPGDTARESWWGGVGWGSSRIMEDSGFPDGGTRTLITEFPAFSWILGDLHPHVIAYPWLIATLALIANLFLVARSSHRMFVAPAAIATGLALGVLYSANTWDLPIAGLLALLALTPLLLNVGWREAIVHSGTLAVGALLAAGTFILSYDSPTGGGDPSSFPVVGDLANSLGYVSWDHTSIGSIMEHWGVFLALLLGLVLTILLQWSESDRQRWTWLALGAALLSILSILAGGAPALLLFGIPALAIGIQLHANRANLDASAIPAGFIMLGLIALCAIEFLFIQDPFGDRMNTVFKVSFQVWALLSVSLAALIPSMLQTLRNRFGSIALPASLSILAVGIVASAVYAPISGYHWADQRPGWDGLDGIGYIERFQPDERAAITWLNETDEDVDIVLEAPGCAYGTDQFIPHNRISMATGLPTVIGWDGHQAQWRRGQPELLAEIGQRIEFVQMAYEQPDSVSWHIDDRRITHVVTGEHELTGYQQCGHGPPYSVPDEAVTAESGWEPVFESGSVTIYRVEQDDPVN